MHYEFADPPTAQGRCTWFNPVQKAKDEFEDEEEEDEEKEQIEEPEPETGPPLLTTIDQDNRKQHHLSLLTPPLSPPSTVSIFPWYCISFVAHSVLDPSVCLVAE